MAAPSTVISRRGAARGADAGAEEAEFVGEFLDIAQRCWRAALISMVDAGSAKRPKSG